MEIYLYKKCHTKFLHRNPKIGRLREEKKVGVKAVQRDALLHGGVVNHLGQGAGQAQAGGHITTEAARGRTLKVHKSFFLLS